MAYDEIQPDWLQLPLDLLEPIANRSRDAVTGHTVFRSVCRTWRSAVGHAPRLLLPAPLDSRAGSEHALIFPLSRGWSVVVDARDASCRVFHLATGATVVLPKINAFRDRYGTTTHVRYVHYTDDESERERGGIHWDPVHKIFIQPLCGVFFESYLDFSDSFRFALHFPPGPGGARAVSTDGNGMMIMMCHRWIAGQRGMVFCRPGDVAWTEVARCSLSLNDFVDFAFFQDKIYGLQCNGATKVYQDTTLDLLHVIDVPHATLKYPSYVDHPFPDDDGRDEFHYLNLVALPSKVLLVRSRVKSFKLEGFDVFQLGPKSDDDGRIIAWRKVTWDGIGGNFELFLDRYHTAFRENNAPGSGTQIYCVLDRRYDPTVAAYRYDMQENKIECVYGPTAYHDVEYSTKPSWFIP